LKRKVWEIVLGCLTVMVLLLAACGQAAPQPIVIPTTVTGSVTSPSIIPSPVVPTTSVPTSKPVSNIEKIPAYGGTLRIIQAADTPTFDDCYPWSSSGSWSVNITNSKLLDGDWAKGPSGTGETTYLLISGWDGMDRLEASSGLAEKWEMERQPDGCTWTFHLRKDVHFSLNPGSPASVLANGRELLASDVVASMERQFRVPTSMMSTSMKVNAPVSFNAVDKYTVVIKWDSWAKMTALIQTVGGLIEIWPAEVMKPYKDDLRDWHLSVGSGPFVLTDYVKGSSATYIRHTNYYKRYSIPGPGLGMQLPFVDGVKVLVIPDVSTQMAAMRTAKADQLMGYTWENTQTLKKGASELLDAYYLIGFGGLFLNMNDSSFPWANVKVRQALTMAIDFDGIVENYFQGHGEVFTNATSMPEYKDMHLEWKDLPANVQELYSFKPDKAKQLLADAGYSKGFTLEVVANPTQVDMLSIFKDYWGKIGVTLNIDVKDMGVYTSVKNAKSQKQALFTSYSMAVNLFLANFRTAGINNYGKISDSRVEAYRTLWEAYPDWLKQCQIYKDLSSYLMDQSWVIPAPAYESHTIWWPWIKGYHGEYGSSNSDLNAWSQYVWLDLDMREKLSGKR
jgi:peptide/nickel transport system substrate-binding protein